MWLWCTPASRFAKLGMALQAIAVHHWQKSPGDNFTVSVSTSVSEPARIALVHASALAMAPVQQAFAHHWPEAQCMNLLI